MICRTVKANLPDLLLAPKSVSAEVRAHVESCAACGKELQSLEATMALLDTWTAPEVSPYFDTRMAGLMREEQQAAPAAGWSGSGHGCCLGITCTCGRWLRQRWR